MEKELNDTELDEIAGGKIVETADGNFLVVSDEDDVKSFATKKELIKYLRKRVEKMHKQFLKSKGVDLDKWYMKIVDKVYNAFHKPKITDEQLIEYVGGIKDPNAENGNQREFENFLKDNKFGVPQGPEGDIRDKKIFIVKHKK